MAKGPDDDAGMNPEDQLRAALQRDRAEPSAKSEESTARPSPPSATPARTPMIDRRDDTARQVPTLRGNPFASAPPVQGHVDSGGGMGFEFKPKR